MKDLDQVHGLFAGQMSISECLVFGGLFSFLGQSILKMGQQGVGFEVSLYTIGHVKIGLICKKFLMAIE